MEPTRKPSRRSFLNLVVGGAAAGGALALLAGRASAQSVRTGYTDSDLGRGADRAGYGHGPNGRASQAAAGPATGCTDMDAGPNSDPINGGRLCSPNQTPWEQSGVPMVTRSCTDSDTGAGADPARQGSHC